MLIYFISCLYKVLSWETIKLNWYYEYNIQEVNNTKILHKYAFTYYVWSFQEIYICFDRPRHPNVQQWLMTGHYLQCWISKMELIVTIIIIFYIIIFTKFLLSHTNPSYMLQGPYIFLKIGKRFTCFQTSLTYWNATQMLKYFLISCKKTTNKNTVKSRQNVLI